MQVVLKQVPEKENMGLFDTRSNDFIKGCSVANPNDKILLDMANSLVNKSPRTILSIAQGWEYSEDYGYAEAMVAKSYLDLNPDLKERARQLLLEKPMRKTRKLKAPKPVEIDPETGEEFVKVKGKAGRPRRVYTESELEAKKTAPKLGRGRPKKDPSKIKPVVLIDGVKRKRGRPPKQVS